MPGFGRLPSPPDPRRLLVSDLPTLHSATPVDVALAAYRKTHSQKNLIQWMTLVTAAIDGTPPPTPPPPPEARIWRDTSDPILDQGSTPHCVGFAGAGWLADPEPRDVGVTDDTGHQLYYQCKTVDNDGAANREAGSYVSSLAKVLQSRGRVGVYAWATTVAQIDAALLNGPVIVGTDWFVDMMDPDDNGFLHPSGGVVGGHAYVLVGAVDRNANPTSSPTAYLMQNSWGHSWGRAGTALIDRGDFARSLLTNGGEALVTVELPLA